VALLAACVRRGLKVLSATGAGARADPTRIRIADLRESTNDPLSRSVMFPHMTLLLYFIDLKPYLFSRLLL
jgi:hypothetical protein